jgi:DNA-binding NtrC family response regulator
VNESLSVLVVDDDWPMAKTLVDVLKLKGFKAEAACSGPAALEMVGSDQFDCVLTDVKMPVVNGVELLMSIKAGRPHLPVLLMTAYAPGDLVHEGLREGAVASFVKPLDIDLLVWFLSELSGPRAIVIVDDDSRSWRTAEQALEQRGFAVKTVRDPDGLMQALKPRGQVVFLGPRLNGCSGLELLKQIRKQYGTLPVVLTCDGQEEASSKVERARRLTADACLRKPFEMDELLEILADIRGRELTALLQRRSATLVHQNDWCDRTMSCVSGDAVFRANDIS